MDSTGTGSVKRLTEHYEEWNAINNQFISKRQFMQVAGYQKKPNESLDNKDISTQLTSLAVRKSLAMPVESETTFAEYLTTKGLVNMAVKLDDIINDHSQLSVNIGVTGQSGAGKSTLINTIRSLIPREGGAAPVGTHETTMEITPYTFPGNDEITLWDLPGVNTPNFPKDTYIDKVNLRSFDGLLIVSSSRVSELDGWLAREAESHHIPFYLIRTKVDLDVAAAQDDHGMSEEEAVEITRQSMIKTLAQINVNPKALFMVCGKFSLNGQMRLDFPKLNEELINNSPPKNTRALIQSLLACSENIIEIKKNELLSKIPYFAMIASDKYKTGQHEDVISETISVYFQWFGIDESLLVKFNIRMAEMREKIVDKYDTLKMHVDSIPPTVAPKASKRTGKPTLPTKPKIAPKPKSPTKKKGGFFARFRKKRRPDIVQNEPESVEEPGMDGETQLKVLVFCEAKELLRDILDDCVELAQAIIEKRREIAQC